MRTTWKALSGNAWECTSHRFGCPEHADREDCDSILIIRHGRTAPYSYECIAYDFLYKCCGTLHQAKLSVERFLVDQGILRSNSSDLHDIDGFDE